MDFAKLTIINNLLKFYNILLIKSYGLGIIELFYRTTIGESITGRSAKNGLGLFALKNRLYQTKQLQDLIEFILIQILNFISKKKVGKEVNIFIY